MSDESSNHRVVEADVCRGDLLVYFSDGTAVMFRSELLYAVREQGGNRTLSILPEDEEN